MTRLFPFHGLLLLAGCACLVACGPRKGDRTASDGQIHVVTVPAGAIVSLEGGPPQPAPVTFPGLPPGAYLINAHKDGYEEARQTVRLDPNEKTAVEIKLTPLTGLLLIHSTPPGAEVELDGISLGTTPLFRTDVAMGKRRLTLSTPGFLPRTIEVTVSDRRPQKIEVDLRSDSARLQVESEPPGANVTLDGSAVGKTPWENDRTPPGRHTLELTLAGYGDFRTEFELKSGEERRVRAVLKSQPGFLSVRSIPEGARIFVNGAPVRDAPNGRLSLDPGTHEIRAELKGYEHATVFREIRAGEEADVELRLVKNSGMLVLTTDPAGVAVFVDGEQVGVTAAAQAGDVISEPLQIDLLERGQHKLQLTKKGFFDVQKTVDIAPNKTLILHEKLRLRPVAFVPNVIIRAGPTEAQVFRGVIRETYDNGDILVETSPGIFKTFRLSEVRIETISDPYAPPAPKPESLTPPKPAPAPAAPPAPTPTPTAPAPSQPDPLPGVSNTSALPPRPASRPTPPPAAASAAQPQAGAPKPAPPAAGTAALRYNKNPFQVAALMHGQRRLTPGALFELTPRLDTATTPDRPVSFQCRRQSDAADLATYVPCVALPAKPNAAGEPQLLFRHPPPPPGESKLERVWPAAQAETDIAFPAAFDSPGAPPQEMRADSGRAFFFLMDLDTGKPLSNIVELEIPLPKARLSDMLGDAP
jgi:hypothetical protein